MRTYIYVRRKGADDDKRVVRGKRRSRRERSSMSDERERGDERRGGTWCDGEKLGRRGR